MPAPFGPRSPKHWPDGTCSDTRSSARTFPFGKTLTSSCASTARATGHRGDHSGGVSHAAMHVERRGCADRWSRAGAERPVASGRRPPGSPMRYVFDFDHAHRRAPEGSEGPPRRQGREPRRDDVGAQAAGAAGLHDHDRRLPGVAHRGDARGARRRGRPRTAAARARDGQAARRRARPAARLGPLRREVLDARDDGHGPQPRPQRPLRRGARAPDRRPPLRPRLVPALHLDVRPHRARRRRPPRSTSRSTRPRPTWARRATRACRPSASPSSSQSCKAIVLELTGRPFPQDPAAQLLGAIEAVFSSWGGDRAIAYREREGIAHDLGTAVNVQAMVFGNRDDHSGTGVGFTRDPATGKRGAYGDFLVNAQGEDVVAGIRLTEPLSAMRRTVPEGPHRAARDLRPPGAPLPGHVRHGVHDRAGPAVDAADAGRQADRARRAAHGGRDDAARRPAHLAARGRRAGSPRSTSTRCCTRSSRQGGPPRSPRGSARRRAPRSGGATSPRTTPSPPPRAARRRCSCDPRPRPRT